MSLVKWYKLDENAKPLEYCLKPREHGGPFEDYTAWGPVEQELMTILQKAAQDTPLEEYERLKYGASATEQEIARGALLVTDARDHVFGFFRTIQELPQDLSSARDFMDLDESKNLDQKAHDLLEDI